MRLFPSSLFSLLLLTAGGGSVTAQKPQSSVTRFAHLPSKIYYFDDTSVSPRSLPFRSLVRSRRLEEGFEKLTLGLMLLLCAQSVLYHDPLLQNVHRSGNEGKEWKLVDGIPEGEAAQLVEHPTDNQVVSSSFY